MLEKFWFDGAPDKGAEVFERRHTEPSDFIEIMMIQLIANHVEMRAQKTQVTDHAARPVRRSSKRNFAVIRVPVNPSRTFRLDGALQRVSSVEEESLRDFVVHHRMPITLCV